MIGRCHASQRVYHGISLSCISPPFNPSLEALLGIMFTNAMILFYGPGHYLSLVLHIPLLDPLLYTTAKRKLLWIRTCCLLYHVSFFAGLYCTTLYELFPHC
ncbi:hypothetical protein EV363DRAFT_1338246, partial [Boletus edulis]